jgi:hypothetical protein
MQGNFAPRQIGSLDLATLASVLCVALATWACLDAASGVAEWRPSLAVVVMLLLALAALTRHPRWAAMMRLLTGSWIVAAPYLLGFAAAAPAARIYLGVGVLLSTMAVPPVAALYCRRPPLAV